MPTGTVKYWNSAKGFGFITADGQDHFVHIGEVQRAGEDALEVGQKVAFQVVLNRNGDGRTRAAYLQIL